MPERPSSPRGATTSEPASEPGRVPPQRPSVSFEVRDPRKAVRPGSVREGLTPARQPQAADAPPGLSGRFLGTLALVWTATCGAWLGWTAIEGKLETPMVAVAVVGFVGIVWLLGLLIVLIFWLGRAEPISDPSDIHEDGGSR